MKKKFTKIIAIMAAVCCMVSLTTATSLAATKEVTRTNTVISGESAIKALSFYGKDVFKITCDGKKIHNVKYSHQSKDLNSGMIQYAGIKCLSKTTGKWTYQTKWKVNCKLMPKKLVSIANKLTPSLTKIQKIGTIVEVTTTYNVTAKGELIKTKTSLKWFTTISKYKQFLDKLFKF